MKNGKYELIVAPDWYTGKRYRGRYAYKHRVVAAEKIGRPLDRMEVAHHINEIKMDNQPVNIEIKSLADHSREHQPPAGVSILRCKFCGKKFERLKHLVDDKLKNGQKDFYCNRSCMASDFGGGRPKH